jgi:hypothetical protein
MLTTILSIMIGSFQPTMHIEQTRGGDYTVRYGHPGQSTHHAPTQGFTTSDMSPVVHARVSDEDNTAAWADALDDVKNTVSGSPDASPNDCRGW